MAAGPVRREDVAMPLGGVTWAAVMGGAAESTSRILGATWTSIGISLLLIALGLAAVLAPEAAGVTLTILILWIIFFSGLAHLVHAWDARGNPMFLWRLLVGGVYVAGALFLLLNPGYGFSFLTLFIAAMFSLEAGLLFGAFFWLRGVPGAGWIAADGALTLAFAVLIALLWPWSSPWMLAMLVGMNIIVSGAVRLGLARRPDGAFMSVRI